MDKFWQAVGSNIIDISNQRMFFIICLFPFLMGWGFRLIETRRRAKDRLNIELAIRQEISYVMAGFLDEAKMISYIYPTSIDVDEVCPQEIYQEYMSSLPIQTRHEMIDKLLDNQAVKNRKGYDIKPFDIPTLVSFMTGVEIRTLLFVINKANVPVETTVSDIANDIIAFKLSNPY